MSTRIELYPMDGGPPGWHAILEGVDIAGSISSVTLHADGEGGTATIRLESVEMIARGEVDAEVDERTEQALRLLGWEKVHDTANPA